MSRMDRRLFLGTAAGGLAALGASRWTRAEEATAAATVTGSETTPALPARPDTLFLTWQRDPTTTMTVQWIGPDLPMVPKIGYAPLGQDAWQTVDMRKTAYPLTDQHVYRAELTGLSPGTEYQFRIGEAGTPHRFRTMPAKATDSFTFVSGGDCGTNEHAIANNIIAARQDPMFALIGGDLGYDNGRDAPTSIQFMRNYSQHMVDTQGRLIPLVVCIGNHEVNGSYNRKREHAPFYFALHDGLYAETSYAALDFGDYLSLVLLDAGHVTSFGDAQADWLDKTLAERSTRQHVIAVNHEPAYPSNRAFGGIIGGGGGNRKFWVPLFEKHNVDLVLEHHDHTFKRTHPMLGGHVDKNGILYLGDGSWGKIRPPVAPEKRPYLATAAESYHFSVHRLEGPQRFHMAIDDHGKIIDVCMTTKRSQTPVSG